MFKNAYTVVQRKDGEGDNMTRGRVYLKPKKGEWIESTQFNSEKVICAGGVFSEEK